MDAYCSGLNDKWRKCSKVQLRATRHLEEESASVGQACTVAYGE